ncbi:MAG: hypothetical protein MJY74_03575 [Bacteroidaceae bacterium]|nr:hypothetical protein [Bacteroidaceae bacterium]
MKKLSVSSIVLWALIIISVIVLLMFYCFGFGNIDTIGTNTYTAPMHTGTLIVWLYILVILCAGSVFGFAIYNAIFKAKHKSVEKVKATDWAGYVLLGTLVIVIISSICAGGAPVRLGDNSLFENTFLLKLSEVCLFSIYVLVVLAILATAASMIGLFKTRK